MSKVNNMLLMARVQADLGIYSWGNCLKSIYGLSDMQHVNKHAACIATCCNRHVSVQTLQNFKPCQGTLQNQKPESIG